MVFQIWDTERTCVCHIWSFQSDYIFENWDHDWTMNKKKEKGNSPIFLSQLKFCNRCSSHDPYVLMMNKRLWSTAHMHYSLSLLGAPPCICALENGSSSLLFLQLSG